MKLKSGRIVEWGRVRSGKSGRKNPEESQKSCQTLKSPLRETNRHQVGALIQLIQTSENLEESTRISLKQTKNNNSDQNPKESQKIPKNPARSLQRAGPKRKYPPPDDPTANKKNPSKNPWKEQKEAREKGSSWNTRPQTDIGAQGGGAEGRGGGRKGGGKEGRRERERERDQWV